MSDIKLTTGEIQTAKGTMKFELYDDDANCRCQFQEIVSKGFYDGLKFHRVIITKSRSTIY